jgi:RNA polymerase sigma-70 factor (ECF subfamily)
MKRDYGAKKIAVDMDSNFSALDDESLIRRIQEGSREAFAMLVYRHSKRFYRMAYRFVSNRDDAEDIVQDAFLKLWHKPHMWDAGKQSKFTTWFHRVIINLCLDQKKKKKPLDLPEAVEFADKHPGQDALFDAAQKQAFLDDLVHRLPERQQLALNLCFYEGLTNKEAAEILGIEVKAVQSLIMRAKATLKKKVKPYLGGGSR